MRTGTFGNIFRFVSLKHKKARHDHHQNQPRCRNIGLVVSLWTPRGVPAAAVQRCSHHAQVEVGRNTNDRQDKLYKLILSGRIHFCLAASLLVVPVCQRLIRFLFKQRGEGETTSHKRSWTHYWMIATPYKKPDAAISLCS